LFCLIILLFGETNNSVFITGSMTDCVGPIDQDWFAAMYHGWSAAPVTWQRNGGKHYGINNCMECQQQ